MKNQSTVFDRCETSDEIGEQLQSLSKELLAAIKHGGRPFVAGQTVDLNSVAELSDSELRCHDAPVFTLSEICRLMIKQGDTESLKMVLRLSFRIHALERSEKQNGYLSHLFKGIAQIGLKQTDIGIKNVIIGLPKERNAPVVPADQCLGFWALMSAAIINKNIKLALRFARDWREAAELGKLENEVFRSKMVIHIFNLLLGNKDEYAKTIHALIAHDPGEWGKTILFLEQWTNALTGNECQEVGDFSDPYPLFLGFDWRLASLPDDKIVGDFSLLCELRRRFCNETLIEKRLTKNEKETVSYAELIAQWEISRPLREFEAILKTKAPSNYLQFTMTRVLGKKKLQKVTCETPSTPDIVMQEDAIILVMDVRKYSSLSERHHPEEIFDILNPVFKIMTEEFEKAGGAILEFVGDCIIVAFNVFGEQKTAIYDILSRAVRCLRRIHVLSALSMRTGLPEIKIGMGINKGPVALGYLGGLARCHLTVLGNAINLSARLETASKSLPGDIIVSKYCFDNEMPDVWAKPENINYSVRDLGPYDKMKNISEPAHLFGISPLIRYWIDFVPMGFVAQPEKGVIYIDTGNSDQAGIIDHHFIKQRAKSACELLNRNPELLLDHVKNISSSEIEFRLHESPDLDCAATLYTAFELLEKNPRKAILNKLADYVSLIDQGKIPQPDRLADSLKGIFVAHQKISERYHGDFFSDLLLLEAEMRVVDAAVYLMQQHGPDCDFATIFQYRPHWFAEERRMIEKDMARYAEDIQLRSKAYNARVNGLPGPAIGLWIDHPKSIFFKLWARTDPNAPSGNGYAFLSVDCSTPEKNRFILSVDPESGTNLNGLGQLLEKRESEKRKKLGKERPVQPVRYPSDNSDPWYFGQGHGFTIIDSPWCGTLLPSDEVLEIHENW